MKVKQMELNHKPQMERVIDFMTENGSITQKEAIKYLGVPRLAAVMHRINHTRAAVRSQRILVLNRYGEPVRVARYSFTA